MGNVFGEQKSTKEIVKEQQRLLKRSIRQLDRERKGLERQEAKLVQDIKAKAKAGQMKSVKIMAKDLVRLRKHQEKFLNLSSQLQAINLQMTTMTSQQALVTSMKQATKAMTRLNRQVKLPALQKTMMEFQRESEKMEMQSEMMGEAIDDAMEDEEDEEDEERIVNQVLDELDIRFEEDLVDAPSTQLQKDKAELQAADKALEDRLKNL
jgi:charged multivesicular body protein 2A